MKRKLTFISSLIFLLPFLVINSQASENKEMEAEKELILATEEVDQKYLNYVKENSENVFNSLNDVVPEDLKNYDLDSTVSYGNPFKLNEVNYIPIVIDNDIVALLSANETEGILGWSISRDFSKELDAIAEYTSHESPAKLYTFRGNVYANISGERHQISHDPEFGDEKEPDYNKTQINEGDKIVDILKTDQLKTHTSLRQVYYRDRARDSNYLYLNLKENQTDKSWSVAFARAQILRYKGKGDIYAGTIMKGFYPKDKQKDLENRSLSDDKLIFYANKQKSYPQKSSKL